EHDGVVLPAGGLEESLVTVGRLVHGVAVLAQRLRQGGEQFRFVLDHQHAHGPGSPANASTKSVTFPWAGSEAGPAGLFSLSAAGEGTGGPLTPTPRPRGGGEGLGGPPPTPGAVPAAGTAAASRASSAGPRSGSSPGAPSPPFPPSQSPSPGPRSGPA